jgi:hypothetical protein
VEVIEVTEVVETVEVIEAAEVPDAWEITNFGRKGLDGRALLDQN